MRLNRPISVLCLATALASGGCQPAGHPRLGGAGMDIFTPVAMRLHPLSRLTGSTNAPVIEARIELTDQFGDVGKGVGTVGVDLFTYSAMMPNHKGTLIEHWNVSLSTPAENRARWDAITRTYLFSLPVTAGKIPPGRLLLFATFTLPNGARFTDDLILPAK